MNMQQDFNMIIDGKTVAGASEFDVFNPATGEAFAKAPECSEVQLDEAVASARRAFPEWKKLSYDERAEYLNKMGQILIDNAAEMARLFTLEQGRPIGFAQVEITSAGEWFQSIAKMRPEVDVHEDSDTQLIEVHHVPLGVICAIAPWNFPVSLAVWKIAPALLTGNTMVLKPSPFTPLCTLKMGEMFAEILPAGVLNIITGGDNLGPWMTSHPGFDKISFTGSSATGKRVMESASKDLKRLTLELGGNDAAIVMPDVDLDDVAQKIFFGSFFNTAQICVATKRLYVHEDVYDGLRDRLIAIAKATKIGDGTEQGTDMGPIQNKRQYDRVQDLLDDAKKTDLTVIECSDLPDGEGYFIPITIVDNPPEQARVVQEEAFGPILPMLKFTEVDNVIARANASEYGLAGAVWSKDTDKAMEIARQMETGVVWINHNLNMLPGVPFAGHKQSGFGVENGMEGLLEYTTCLLYTSPSPRD